MSSDGGVRKRGRPKKKLARKEQTVASKMAQLRQAFVENVITEKLLDLDEWSDKYRQLPQETSSEHGQWVTARFPFLRRIMKKLSPSSIAQEIVVMKGAQLGFTELAISWMLYVADQYPSPMLYCQKTESAAQDFSNQKLRPNITANPRVYNSLGDGKPPALADSWDDKGFPGGFLSIGGANSPEFLKSKSVRYACTDEEASYEATIGKDGSPVMMIRKRQANFPDRKLYRPSTPQLAETCTITAAYEFSTQEHYYVPCPHCNPTADETGFMFWFKWENIKYTLDDKGLPCDVYCECPNCGGHIDEIEHKSWMMANGDWFSEKNSSTRYRVPDSLSHSFHISSLYSPVGFFSWYDACKEWCEYLKRRDNGVLQVFVNQTLAEAFTMTGAEISYNYLYDRRERYSVANDPIDVPAGGLVLTVGADVQKDRIECCVVAHGLLDERWLVDYAVFSGDTSQLGNRDGYLADGHPSVWNLFDNYLMRTWKHESGDMLPIEFGFVDGRYRTDEVNVFCRLREHRRLFVVYGKDGWSRPSILCSRRRHEKFHTVNYIAGVDLLKNKVMSQLKLRDAGPGFIHFPVRECFSERYFKGLTCESLKSKMVNGTETLYWFTPPGARNEPLDTLCYAVAAVQAYPVNLERRAAAVTPLQPLREAQAPRPLPARRKRMSAGL